MQETCIWSLGWEDPLEREMAAHSSTLAWKILWTEEPGGLQSMGLQSQIQLNDFTFTWANSGRRWMAGKLVCWSPWGCKLSEWVKSLSCVQLFVALWTVAHQAPPSIGFSRQENWSGLPFPSPGDLPNPRIEPRSPALQADALTSKPPGKPTRGCKESDTTEWLNNN